MRNISLDNLFEAEVRVTESGGAIVQLHWHSTSTGPIVGRNEVSKLSSNVSDEVGINTYVDIKMRFTKLKEYATDSDYVLYIGGINYVSAEAIRILNAYERQFDELYGNITNKITNSGYLANMIPESKSSSKRGTKAFDTISKEVDRLSDNVHDSMLGPTNSALQIGWLSFGPENDDLSTIRLGPDKVTFVDLNNITTSESLRSDSDIAIKDSNGRATLEVDLIFPNVKSINGTIISENDTVKGTPGLRDLLALLRMAPVVPIGGEAVAAALINQVVAKEVYDQLREYYLDNYSKADTDLFKRAKEEIGEPFNVSFDALNEILKNDRDTYNLLNRHLNNEAKKEKIKANALDSGQNLPPSQKDFVESLGTHSVLLPMVCTNILLSTIKSAVGAVRVRLTFEKFHNPYEPSGGVAFYDRNGDATYDIRKATPLIDSVRSVYLNPKRYFPETKGTLQKVDNKYYIPTIGDTSIGSSGTTLAGFVFKDTKPRWRINDEGFMEYAPPGTGADIISAKYSPIMFRFAPASNPGQVYEYIPNDMILENVSWNLSNKIATFPMEGQLYPGFQHMGRASVQAALKFVTTDKKAIQKFFTVKNVMDLQSKSNTVSALFRREFCDAYNDILNLSGASRWIISSAKMETNPDNPGLYELSVELISNMESTEKREKLELITKKADDKSLSAFWWWMYGALFSKFYSHSGRDIVSDQAQSFVDLLNNSEVFTSFDSIPESLRSNISENGRFTGGYTQSEIDSVWELVFGRFSGDKYTPGILEENIFLAAFLEVIKNGHANIPVEITDIFADYFNSSDPNGIGFDNVGQLLSALLNKSRLGAKNTIKDEEFQTNKGSYEDLLDIPFLLETFADYYENKKDKLTKLQTPWWISSELAEYGGSKADGTPYWLRQIAAKLNDAPDDESGLVQRTIINKNSNFWWLPTPDMWAAILYVIKNWSELIDKQTGKPYKIQSASSTDIEPFLITTVMKTMRSQLSEVVSNGKYRKAFPSFWRRQGQTVEDFASTIDPFGNKPLDPKDYILDISRIEFNNNYIDLPMPKYYELFSEGINDKNAPQPRKVNGYEVWRKIAPNYLELGIKPDIYSSLSLLTEPDTVAVKYPALLTPRSFYDYCDPGFFYYRRSWLTEQYADILETIDHKVDNTKELSPTGGNSSSFSLNQRELELRKEFEKGTGPELKIARADFVYENLIMADNAVQTNGLRTTFTNQEEPFGFDRNSKNAYSISKGFARAVEKEIIDQISTPTIAKNVDLERLADLYQNQVSRVWVLDGSGRRCGVIVSGSGATKGNITELKDVTKAVTNRLKQDGSSLYFIDLSPYIARTPGEVTYKDHAAVLSHNIYKDEDAKKVYRDTISNIGDLTSNHLRAYPTFKLYFVRETVKDDKLITSLEEDMYGYHSVISLDIVHDKDDSSTAKIVVTDISGALSTAQFDIDNVMLKDETPDDVDNLDASEDIFKSRRYDRIKLSIGTNILIKMGYGNNPDTLKTVFTGAIAEIEPGPITTIIAQDFKTELFRQVNILSSKDLMGIVWDNWIKGEKLNLIGANYLIFRVLRELATSPVVTGYDSAGGIPHLGHFISLDEFLKFSPDSYNTLEQAARDAEAEEGANRVSNLISGGGLAAGALLILSRGRATRTLAGVGAAAFGIANEVGNFSSDAIKYLQKYDANYMHTNAMRNVFITDDPTKDSWFGHMALEWLIDTDGWNAIKEITRYKVGYICQVVPYGAAATLVVAKPEQPYHYKPLTEREKAKLENAQPFAHLSSFGKLYKKVFSEYFNSSEHGIDSVPQQWYNFINNTDIIEPPPVKNGSQSTLDSYTTLLNTYIRAAANAESTSINSTFINSKLDWLKRIDILPSFAISRYIINKLKLNKSIKTDFNTASKAKISNLLPKFNKFKSEPDIYLNDPDELILIGNGVGTIYQQYPQWSDVGNIADIKITEETLLQNSYGPNDYWGIKRNGQLISRSALINSYSIDPKNGKPTYNIGDHTFIPKQVNPEFGAFVGDQQIFFATTLGFGSFVADGITEKDLRFSPKNDFVNAYKQASSSEDPMILLADYSEHLEYLNKFGPNLQRLLFAIFFGLTWVKSNDNITFLGESEVLDSVYKDYVDLIMKGSAHITEFKSTSEASDSFGKKLMDPISGVLSPITSRGNIKYGSIAAQPQLIDIEGMEQILDAELKEMIFNGRIRQEEVEVVKQKMKDFLRLASLGRLSSILGSEVDNQKSISDAAKSYIFSNNDKSRFGELSSIIDKVYSQSTKLDQDLIDAFSVIMDLDPRKRAFDPNRVEDLLLLKNRLIGLNITDTSLTKLNMSDPQKNALRFVINKANITSSVLNKEDAILVLSTFTDGKGIDNLFESVSTVSDRQKGLAFGLESDASIYSILVTNADYFKLFLIFFVKWLKKEGNTDKTLRELKVDSAVRKAISSDLAPGTKRFQDVHYILSGVDIIENNIIATMSEMANNILLMSPAEIEVSAQNSENSPTPIFHFDAFKTKYIPYPNYQYNGVDWNPFMRPELRKQRVVIERNAESDQQRMALLINHMAEAIRPMYRGHIKVIGRVIKPHDKVVLVDSTNDMFGVFEVENVHHSFSAEGGWTTKIIPHAYITTLEPSADLLNQFDTTVITSMLKTLDAFDWVLNAWFIAGLILAPFSGGASAAGAGATATAAKQGAKRAVMGGVRKAIADGVKKLGSKLGDVAIKAGSFANKEGTEGLLALLKSAYAGGKTGGRHFSWTALGATSIDSIIGRRAAMYGLGAFAEEALKWGVGLSMTVGAEQVLKSSTLPIHTFTLTRFGSPFQAGLDSDITRWYTWSERFGLGMKQMTDTITSFVDEAFKFRINDPNTKYTIFKVLEGR